MADDTALDADADAARMAMARLRAALRPQRDDPSRAPSHVALGREYLRRMALWAPALGREEQWPFFDVVPPTMAEPAVIPAFLEPCPHLVREVFAAWLRYVAHAPSLARYGLADPYLPLVRLLERGGTFHRHKQIFYCGVRGIPYARRWPLPATWLAHELPLNDVALDAIDAAERAPGGR